MPSKTVLDAENYIRNHPTDEACDIIEALLEELAEYEVLAEPPVLDDVELAPDIYDDDWFPDDFGGDDETSDEGQAH